MMATHRFRYWVPFFGLLLLSACNVTKHLDKAKGQRLLWANSLELKADKPLNLGERTALAYELGAYYKQKPNKRGLFGLLPVRLWLHYRYKDRDSKFARWTMRKQAEPPAIYDEALTQKTARNLENVMRQRGYFRAQSSYRTDTLGRHKIRANYRLDLGPMFTIDTVKFASRDSQALQVLYINGTNSLLRTGAPLDARTFDQEKLRVTAEMKNRGYAYFTPNFVRFNGDTIGTRSNVEIEIVPPSDTSVHKQYTINQILVRVGLVPNVSYIRKDQVYNDIYFVSADTTFSIKPERLFKSISIRPSWPYRQVDFDQTQRDLNALGIYKFVTVKPVPDSTDRSKINVDIALSPDEKLTIGSDLDLNSSTSSSGIARNLIGIAGSLNFRNRNVFRGAEHWQSNALYNIEFDVATSNRFIFSQEFQWQNNLVFPRFFDYLNTWETLNGLRLGKRRVVSNSLLSRMKSDGQARFSLNYDYLEVFDLYNYNLVTASFGFDLRSNPEHQYTIDHIGIDVLRPRTYDRFNTIFGQNKFLRSSFGNQLFTGFLLRSFSYTYATRNNRFGERWLYRFGSDLSGFEEFVVNRLWSVPFGKQRWSIDDLDFSKYLRLDMDAVYTRDFNAKLTAALRIGAGAVMPFGDTVAAPYVKQFFAGGPTSVRAWSIRELGPGGYYDPEASQVRPFYQAGDFRFELNGELRFPMFWWLKGAVFVDAGNIWTLRPDPLRPNSELRWNSYRNIALGTGLGLRFDFSYFVLRFDAGLQLRRPYTTAERPGYWVPNRFSHLQIKDFRPNLAVGYPF
jgi:outer membrane protein insertion porin family